MPRVIKQEPPTLLEPPSETWTISLRTITPMFGGSARPREVDAQNPVRAASVRGHLRFWWRATAGAIYSDPKELFEAEEAIWGSAEKQGLVALHVYDVTEGERKNHRDFVNGYGDPRGYALFPFAENRREGSSAAFCLVNVAFNLCINCPSSVRVEVQNALSAWVWFGGIGARTRRGCGSLEAESQSFAIPKVNRIHNNLSTLSPSRYFVGQKQPQAVEAWARAVEIYRQFRQGVPNARSEGRERNRPGRSKWPEADTIRRLSGRFGDSHTPKHPVDGFPRADLGLPIVFHFMNEREGDPPDHVLESAGKHGTRFASPVITKAIKVDGGYAPAIILLDAPHVWEVGDLKFERQKRDVSGQLVELTPQERQKISPLNGLPIREALLEFTKSRGFKEVRL